LRRLFFLPLIPLIIDIRVRFKAHSHLWVYRIFRLWRIEMSLHSVISWNSLQCMLL
jgi:hypothetical protein